jgi:hypothetical protein
LQALDNRGEHAPDFKDSRFQRAELIYADKPQISCEWQMIIEFIRRSASDLSKSNS